MPQVSVVLPVRNGAATIERAVRSCLDQTLRDLEIVIVDDHSTDSTPLLIQAVAEADPRIRAISSPEPGGIVTALNVGIEAAHSNLIARMDADDLSHPSRLEKQVALFDADPTLMVAGCQVHICKSDGQLGEGYRRYQRWVNACVEPEQILRERFIESPLPHPSVMMRRTAFEHIGRYRDCEWAEDYDLWLRMMASGMRIGKVPEVLLDWHDVPTRLSRCDSRYSLENFQRCKAHHLAQMDSVRVRGVTIWAAGPIGKRMARFLQAEKITVHQFVEVNPRRIGTTIRDVPVVGVEQITRDDQTIHLAAAGQPGRRDEVRRCLRNLGMVEGESFFCAA